jgi:hypothetical protein
VPKALLATCVCQLCLYYSDLYDDPRAGGDNSALLIRTLQALGMTLLVLAFLYGMFPALTIGRGVIGPGVTFAAAALIAWRIAFGWLTRQVGPRERLLIVGISPSALALARELRQKRRAWHRDRRLRRRRGARLPLGAAAAARDDRGRAGDRSRPAGRSRRGQSRRRARQAADGQAARDEARRRRFEHFASVYEEHTGKIAVENLRPSWLIFSAASQVALLHCGQAGDGRRCAASG